MTTGISILKHIRTKLLANTELAEIVVSKVFSYVAEDSTTYPFVVMKKSNVTANYTKDGRMSDSVVVDITIVGDNYSIVVNIAELVRASLERVKHNGIVNCELLGNNEDYITDAYVSTLTFSITIK